MANALYGLGREKFLRGELSWNAHTIRVHLIDTGEYSVNIDTHEFLSSVPSAARVGDPATLSGKTTTLGVADADDISFTDLTSAPSIEALIIYRHNTNDADSALIAYIDTADGLPVAAGATRVDVTWSSGANRIFKL